MDKIVEDAIKIETIELAKKHNITDIERLISIMTKIVIDANKAGLDKARTKANPLGSIYRFVSSFDEALSFLPPDKAMDLFENISPIVLTGCNETLEYWFNRRTPFYTHQELLESIKEFIKYLKDDKVSVILTGCPVKSFETSYWIYHKLAHLYPVKVPASNKNRRFLHQIIAEKGTRRRELIKRIVFLWLLIKEKEHPLMSFDPQKRRSYEKNLLLYGFTDKEIEQIEENRIKLFNLKIRILEIACTHITKNIVTKKDSAYFWDDCISAISNKLSQQDFQFLRTIEKKYFNLSFLYLLSDQLDISLGESTDDFDRELETGGIRNLFDFIFFIEQELNIGQMHTAKTQIVKLLGNQMPKSYYQVALSPDIAKINKVIYDSLMREQEKEKFYKVFCQRLKKDIEKNLKTPVFVVPEKYDAMKALAHLIEEGHKIGIDLTTRFVAPLPPHKDIYPPQLPSDTHWKDITIKFLDGHTVNINAKGLNVYANYKEMGFEDSRRLMPNKQWELLYLLAHQKGELSWDKPGANRYVKKKKQLLADTLKVYFQIEEDPFLPYKYQKTYKIRINLIPD